MDSMVFLLIVVALAIGVGLGWWLGGRAVAVVRAERDAREEDFKRAISELAVASERVRDMPELRDALEVTTRERDAAREQCAILRTEAKGFEARFAEFKADREVMTAQFRELGANVLGEAQKAFLERADARFRQSEEAAGQGLKALLQPVTERLQRYEEGVAKVEAERRDAFGDLKGQIEQMRIGQERVSSEAAKLVNSLRNAPKSRGRWGEQQLKNVLETCGLSEHTDFETEVSVAGGDEGGRLRAPEHGQQRGG